MRPFLCSLPLAVVLAPACSSWPGLDRPQVDAGAYLALYELRGRARRSSLDAGGNIQRNPGMELSMFGVGDRDDDVGGWSSVGDGFSGFQLDYFKLTMKDTSPGILDTPFGELEAEEEVVTEVEMDEWRARYLAQILEHTFGEVRVQLGIGLQLAHRDLKFFPKRVTTGDGQLVTAKDDGVLYAVARLRASRGPLSVTLDWAYDDGVDFGGDFEGRLQDIELLARYEVLRQ